MAGTELRIVRVADELAEIDRTLAYLVPAVRLRLIADGALCKDDRAVLGVLAGVGCQAHETAATSEEDAAHVLYALSLFRADADSRRTSDRRRNLEERYGPLPPLPVIGLRRDDDDSPELPGVMAEAA